MNFLESLRVALTALFANKLRSLLTMLGVIIGVGAVIIMISIIQGARQKVVGEFAENGTNLVFAAYAPKGESRRRGGFEGLTLDDVDAIRREVTLVTTVDPEMQMPAKATFGAKDFTPTVVGITERYLLSNPAKLTSGRFVSAADNDNWDKVCVVGDKVRERLFAAGEDPVGKEIIVIANNVRLPLTVIGALERKGNQGFGSGPDERVFIPISTLQKRLSGSRLVAGISARAIDASSAEEAANQIHAVLKRRHPAFIKDFIVDTQEGVLKQLDTVLMMFQVILGGVAGLSLLVGGIGIMNIMLVSVTERTREIGIRKAVGAKRNDILVQFITESMTVSGLGGLIGVAWGYSVSATINHFAGKQLPTYVPFWAVVLGFGFAVAVGMFFGIYPAVRASKLNPIDALRYE